MEVVNPDNEDLILNYIILAFNLLLLIVEIHQVIDTGLSRYVNDYQNLTDVMGILITLIYSTLFFYHGHKSDDDVLVEKVHLIASFFVFGRATVSSLYIMNTRTRMIIKFLIEAAKDIRYYILTFATMQLANAAMNMEAIWYQATYQTSLLLFHLRIMFCKICYLNLLSPVDSKK